MSLQTDIIFVKAIKSDASILAMLPAGEVYNTTIALPDKDLDNAPVPYIIVTFDGLVNDQSTKDDYEGDTDRVTIGIEIAARNRREVGIIAKKVRKAVHRYFRASMEADEDKKVIPYDYQFDASKVFYDQFKPCHWQTLTYQCDVWNDTTDDEEENGD